MAFAKAVTAFRTTVPAFATTVLRVAVVARVFAATLPAVATIAKASGVVALARADDRSALFEWLGSDARAVFLWSRIARMVPLLCPKCGQPVGDDAPTCPACGASLEPTDDPERVLLETGANLWRGSESVGGKLTLTSRRILFQPHGMNLTTTPFEMERSEVVGVEPYNSLGIVPNGLRVKTRSGVDVRFVVMKRKEAITILKEGL